jgi:hypothetical protein
MMKECRQKPPYLVTFWDTIIPKDKRHAVSFGKPALLTTPQRCAEGILIKSLSSNFLFALPIHIRSFHLYFTDHILICTVKS